jgi:hypothetical protein
MMIMLGWLVGEFLDLEGRSNNKGRDHNERHNIAEGTLLYAWIHPDQRDHQQGRDTKRDSSNDVDRVDGLERVRPVSLAHRDIPRPYRDMT